MSHVPFLHGVHKPLHLSWLSIVHGEHEKLVHEPLVDMCDVQEGQNHLSWPSVVHGEHETMLHEPLVVKCDVQEGQKFLSWQSVMHGEHATAVAQMSVRGLLMCSSKLGDSSSDHAEASKIQVGGPSVVTGSLIPFRFTAKMTFRESIDLDPGAPIFVSPEKWSC
ncbi:hypothetical protein ACOSP7_014371 [Xanthoceras sorbifolium]